ncbi:MAG: phage major capsid protein [Firmicutes bacterium]|nr:phage major capsid protein [Bacillota bacterium]
MLRENAEALIETQIAEAIAQDAAQGSIFMSLARKLPNMTSGQTRVPVLDMLPISYWVNGDTGFKQPTDVAWENVYINAEELAVIIPMPEAVINDASFDILGEIQPRIIEAMGKRVDEAVLFGINRPASWPVDIITHARQAGNNVSGATVDYDTLLGADGVVAKVEEGGFMVTGGVAAMSMRAKLRGIKDTGDMPIFKTDMQGPTRYALDGAPVYFPLNGSFDTSVAQLIMGDFSRAVYSIRQDITVKILDQGVIQDPVTKNIVYNLAQQDMLAIRVVMRMGWALPNPATMMNADRIYCPFAYLEPATAITTQAVTFTVNDSEGTAIAGATVNLNGARLKTDASGKCVFNLRDGSYPVKISKTGYISATDTVEVAGSAVTKTAVLTAKA